MPDMDFDPFDSGLQVGVELEYPKMEPGDERFLNRGWQTMDLQSRVSRMPTGLGTPTYDGTVGLEVVSSVIDVSDMASWYRDVVEHVESEWNTPYQPTGLLADGSTAGLHIHLSPLTDEEARELYEISQTPWAKVLFCSSIAHHNDSLAWPVFRGGRYCQMDGNINGSRYNCINNRGNGHFEWRMPEPVAMDHIEIIAKFLDFFKQDPSIARDYAQELLDDADDRLTAIKRAEAVGMDFDEVPTVARSSSENDPASFYQTVADQWMMPEIYCVNHENSDYYVFESDLDGVFEAEGVQFTPDDVLRAVDLTQVQAGSNLYDDIIRAFRSRNDDTARETEATEELKKIIKKKKGK